MKKIISILLCLGLAFSLWPVNGFVKANDFTGKAAIPFCTSASSGIGESDIQLKAMAKKGDWKDGKRFSSSASDSDIADWLK